jgi:hypothetical protein
MSAQISIIAITLLGSFGLIGLQLGPKPDSRRVAAVLPPWHADALARAAATGLPIVDLHWNGRMIVLEISGTPTGADLLRGQGFWVVDASGAALCGLPPERNDG